MRTEIERITSIIPDERWEELRDETLIVSNEMKDSIEKHQKHRIPIDKTRRAMGITVKIEKVLKVFIRYR